MRRVLAILENAWGVPKEREGETFLNVFEPNPKNRSAKRVLSWINKEDFLLFTNVNLLWYSDPKKKSAPTKEEFVSTFDKIKLTFDPEVFFVCGKPARKSVEDWNIDFGKSLVLFVPHPAARNLTLVRCEEIKQTYNKETLGKFYLL